tara:strand:- start:1660 stop:1881 length:222 start_codon:yes stop_codon:yes gene_type:complete
LQALGRLDGAEANYKQAIMLKLNYAEAHDHLGVLKQSLGKFEKAEVCYKAYISLGLFEEPFTKRMASKFFNQG